MKYLKACFLCAFIASFVFVVEISATNAKSQDNPIEVYKVNKKVMEFPDINDFSTPEATYAAANRILASGNISSFQYISIKKLAETLARGDAKKREVKPEVAQQWLNAYILEVCVFKDYHAGVIAKVIGSQGKEFYDLRIIELENGEWLNRGESIWDTLENARLTFTESCAYLLDEPSRPKIEDPASHLKPFVNFLADNGKEPKSFVVNALSKYKLVVIGEIHHRPMYWAFNSSVVFDSNFPKYVGSIYLELPSNDQNLVEKFLSSENCDTTPIVEMLRDNLWMGWPDQAMLDFFVSVWMINQHLEPKERVRIVLVDMQRPWKNIQQRDDWMRYNVDRDLFMADNIIKDIKNHSEDNRNGLFIVGIGHAGLNLHFFDGSTIKTAGWHLQQNLGTDNVYVIFQHRCIMTNMGRVDGRLCLGLFDSAFTAIENKPIAFSLETGPFGKQRYDADPDRPVSSTYKDGFNAYLYLGPLEQERFSPLIAGFYTDVFVNELDRRYHIMFDKSLTEGCGLEKCDSENFIRWMNSWGKPRQKWQEFMLGPIDAWHKGGNSWKQSIRDEKIKEVVEQPEIIEKFAKEFFDGLCKSPPVLGSYQTYSDWRGHRKWISETFTTNPINSVKLGALFLDKSNRPAVPYRLILKDGTILEGTLPFDYDAQQKRWYGVEGIDWHLQKKKSVENCKKSK